MTGVLSALDAAAGRRAPFLLSTPNLNFFITCRTNRAFKESLLMSDLCPADGMPVVWIARLMGLPIRQRVAGSDIIEALKSQSSDRRPSRAFFFGGADGVAAAAAATLNSESCGLVCVGAFCPGFGSVEEMSSDEIIAKINTSGADFLVVALGAVKGQEWLRRNHHRLTVPVRSHLGAAMNFQARTLKRAPEVLRRLGLEWLWRISKEPRLWSRYRHDGWALAKLVPTRIVPLVWMTRIRWNGRNAHDELRVERLQSISSITLKLSGSATAPNASKAAALFRSALALGQPLVIDLSGTSEIDARFFGLLLVLRKVISASGGTLRFAGVSRQMSRVFSLYDVDFLLSDPGASHGSGEITSSTLPRTARDAV
jgi:N-acetylglucosaminyldiphosphoundecaprenol N-acetyl-beta-D-mannosaminyltransferase